VCRAYAVSQTSAVSYFFGSTRWQGARCRGDTSASGRTMNREGSGTRSRFDLHWLVVWQHVDRQKGEGGSRADPPVSVCENYIQESREEGYLMASRDTFLRRRISYEQFEGGPNTPLPVSDDDR
jgi:hypothetical protein